MNHSTNIVWEERGELFLHEKALRAYFYAGVHIILARIVGLYFSSVVAHIFVFKFDSFMLLLKPLLCSRAFYLLNA